MELTDHFLSLGSRSNRSFGFSKTFSSFLIVLFLLFMLFPYLAINNFINDSMSINVISEAELSDRGTRLEISKITVKNGDTLSKILTKEELSSGEAYKIISALKNSDINYTPKIGQKISFHYDTNIIENNDDDLSAETSTLSFINIQIDNITRIEITRDGDGFVAKNFIIPLKKVTERSSAVIKGSFMSTAKALGLSTNNILELINAYSYQIDFQRQIKAGDKVTFITEKFYTEEGKFSHSGKVLFASMNLSGAEYNIYRYSPEGSDDGQYFSEDGRSVKRNLLRTPVNVARISSHFGNRKHPIMGYTKMHKGVDFAAPIGTPIFTAGDGVITEMGWKAGYGKFVQVKHSSTLSTAYAHAHNFAKNLKKGSKIKQGQVRAYVGTTGNSTGPHLHYEVRINGKQVNPMSIKGTPGLLLTGAQRTKFNKFKHEVMKL